MAQLLNTVGYSGAVAPVWVILQDEIGNYRRLGGKGLALQAWWVRNWNSKFQWAHSWSLLPPKPSPVASKGQRCVWMSLPSISLVSCGSGERACPSLNASVNSNTDQCVRGEETWTNENACLFSFGETKSWLAARWHFYSHVALAGQAAPVVLLERQDKGIECVAPIPVPPPFPSMWKELFECRSRVSQCGSKGDIKAALSEPSPSFGALHGADTLLQPLTWALPAPWHFSTLRSLLGDRNLWPAAVLPSWSTSQAVGRSEPAATAAPCRVCLWCFGNVRLCFPPTRTDTSEEEDCVC